MSVLWKPWRASLQRSPDLPPPLAAAAAAPCAQVCTKKGPKTASLNWSACDSARWGHAILSCNETTLTGYGSLSSPAPASNMRR